MNGPRRLADIPESSTLVELAQALTTHLDAMAADANGSTDLGLDDLAAHSLAAVAVGTALLHRAAAPPAQLLALKALAHGASLDDVAAAFGYRVEGVLQLLRQYVAGQEHLHDSYAGMGMSPAQADEARALITGAVA